MRKLNNDGMTLVELIVSFALVGILLVVAAELISTSTNAYYEARGQSDCFQLTQTLFAEIRGSIEDAGPSEMYYAETIDGKTQLKKCYDGGNPVYFAVSNDGHAAEFTTGDGEHIALKLIDGDIVEFHYPRYKQTTAGDGVTPLVTKLSDASAVKYDSKYLGLGFKVEDLKFSVLTPDDTDSTGPGCPTIKVELIINCDRYGIFKDLKYIELYRFYEKNLWSTVKNVDDITAFYE